MENTQPRPGIKTSEFYLTIVSSVVGMLVTLGYVTPQEADQLVQAIVTVIGGVLTVVTMGLYIYGRFKLKQQQTKVGTTPPALPIKQALEGLAQSENIGVYPK